MAEAFLQVLIENLASLIQGEIGLILGVNKEMEKISNTFTTIQTVLEDAEDKQFQNKAIQNWLSKLNDIAFEIEDILDECVTEVSKLKGSSRFNLVKKNLYNHKIGKRIKEVAEKLDAIAADRDKYNLGESQFEAKPSQVDWGREMGYVVNEPDYIYGRDEDRDKIVEMLLNQVPNSDHHLSVLPIIGIGGLGKTTLAQLVYNDERLRHHFDTKLWVTVSHNFDLKTLVEAMIESATEKAPDLKHLDTLQSRLQQVLNGKKYLLVLDDVWNENQEAWVKLRGMLLCGSKGSSIVVTTRSPTVGEIMRTLPAHCLKELLEEHCWLLFKLRAFGEEKEQHHHPKLEAIGRQIVKKCAGVPLAAKALGGLLRFKREEKQWLRVKESEIWNLPEDEKNSILPVLRLSYRHLPVVSKRCFVYCAVFPKDFKINKQDLIFRWMAHGCISSKENEEVEDVGDQVWNELVLRSFFQEVDTRERQTTFKMHDLFHDLAQSIMGNKIPRAEMKGSSNTSASNSKIREVHYSKYFDDQTYSSSITLHVSTLTTIMNYNRLRLLKVTNLEITKLPSAIGKLKHLRCLDLECSSIHTLPQTLCGLWNLQTLILTDCESLESLPRNIRCMTNLRHIILEGCWGLRDMPSRIRELAYLKTLSLFIVGHKRGNQLDELEHLNLEGRLEIKHLERVPNHLNAKEANLVGKPNLRDLVLSWGNVYKRASFESANMMDDEKVLEALEPHVNLETLEINEFQGGYFPLWMTKMKNLTELTIESCQNCTHLPPLGGFPHLRSLKLSFLPLLEYMNGEDDIEVQNSVLEVLKLKHLPKLKGLSKKEDQIMFPNLKELNIYNCESLILPPLSLSALQSLSVEKCSLSTLSSFSNCKIENLSYLSLGFDNNNNNNTRRRWNIPEDALDGFSNLKELSIKKAGQQRLPEKWFEGLKSLTKLELLSCKIGSCFPEGWLRYLTALEKLTINSCLELVEMGEEIRYLHLLKKLTLYNVDEMVSLPQGLQHIPTLQSLYLWGLHELTSLPDWLGNLTSLTHLSIIDCPKLQSLPSSIKGITSLKYLWIMECPKLKRRCEKEKGEDWHIIAHIPQLDIS